MSLCHNSDPVELALSAYQCGSGRAVFYFPTWTLQLHRRSFSWATAGSDGNNQPVDPPVRSGQWPPQDIEVHTPVFPSPHLPPSHPYTCDFLIYFCSLLPGELNESKERSGKCLKKQLILSFHFGTETQSCLLGHSQRHVLVVNSKKTKKEKQTFQNRSFALRSLTTIFPIFLR